MPSGESRGYTHPWRNRPTERSGKNEEVSSRSGEARDLLPGCVTNPVRTQPKWKAVQDSNTLFSVTHQSSISTLQTVLQNVYIREKRA